MPADKIHFLTKLSFPERILRLYYTLRPLRWEQYWYRAWYPVKRLFYSTPKVPGTALLAAKSHPAAALFSLPAFDCCYPAKHTFSIHNITQGYAGNIDWNDARNGMLWAYHLNYFGWLRDEQTGVTEQLELLRTYATDTGLRIGLAAYPTSLRSIAWMRFFIRHGIQEDLLNSVLYEHCYRLSHFPEYHIQGNHLWENGSALAVAGAYFADDRFYHLGRSILLKAMHEQVLKDGGHVEGSPMYHGLLLSGLLQCIEFLEISGKDADRFFIEKMRQKAAIMLGWMEQITFKDGNWPQVNDCTSGVAPSLKVLQDFAHQLNLESHKIPLGESGYRMLREGNWELFVDVADIQPAWQPGHAHADTLNFCLNVNGCPFIVDPGITTYEPGEQRSSERSTVAHNTVSVCGRNSSDVWKAFRVGKRATLVQLKETAHTITATHNGFGGNRKAISRTFEIDENNIIIYDAFEALNNEIIELNLHVHPSISVTKIGDSEFLAGKLRINISGAKNTLIRPYQYAEAFNSSITAQRIHIEALTPISITIENVTC